MNRKFAIYPLLAVFFGLLLYSCANIGTPSGGQIDKTPPIFVRSSPKPNECNVSSKKIELFFDEIVTLKDPSTKIIVSPAQTEMPKMSANGKKVTVEIIDTLLPNTTYTIDFSNAIQDNNEGNPLENFAFAFSTGQTVDTMRVSGFVLDAHSLEPMQGVVVGLHSNLADSAFKTTKLERVSLTNDRGQFTIRNVKPGRYRIFAIKDLDRDYKFGNPSEDIAFCDSIIVPSIGSREVSDTIYNINNEIDTVKLLTKPDYRPNDILLNMFNENYKAQYLVKNSRIDSTRIELIFAAPSDTLPSLSITNIQPQPKDWYWLERSATNDTLTYWIRQKELVSNDTIDIAATFLRTDTLNNLSWGTDSLKFTFQRPKPKKKKKKDEEEDSIPQITFLNIRQVTSSTQEVYAPIILESPTPIASIDTAGIRMETKAALDTIWYPVKNFKFALRDTTLNRRFIAAKAQWDPGAEYRLTIDSLAITDIYGIFNRQHIVEAKVRALEDYGNLIFSFPELRDSAFVELLDGSDKVVLTAPVVNHKAELLNLLPSKYYARVVIDRNGNGKYDTGNYSLLLQPEETYYYPAAINLKKNWDIEQTWNIFEQPIDRQKPEAIKKNKPERKKWETAPVSNTEDEENEEGFNDFMDPNDPNMRRFNQMNGYTNDGSNYY